MIYKNNCSLKSLQWDEAGDEISNSSLFTVFYLRKLKFQQLSKHWSYMQAVDAQPEMQDCAQRKIKMQWGCISNWEGKIPFNPWSISLKLGTCASQQLAQMVFVMSTNLYQYVWWYFPLLWYKF